MSKQWFFDAWAVLDGLAFASKRSIEQIDAEQTVFFSVPGLEAVPVGRISTGLLATRFNFQQGFRDEEGQEIAFQSIDQIRETVRRGYLAGGIGPGAGGLEPPQTPVFGGDDVPPPDVPPTEMEPFYELTLPSESKHLLAEYDHYDFSYLADKSKRSELIHSLGNQESAKALYPYLQAFARATLKVWFRYSNIYLATPDRQNALRELLIAMVWMRIWDNPEHDLILHKHSASVVDFLHQYLHTPASLMPPRIDRSLLFSVPCPLRTKWDPRIRMLTDKLFLALSTRDYFQINSELPEFIPALFACILVTLPHSLPPLSNIVPTNAPDLWQTRTQLVRTALYWLDNQLPQLALPDRAERALTKFAWDRLSPPTC